jgi:hypothetical protein
MSLGMLWRPGNNPQNFFWHFFLFNPLRIAPTKNVVIIIGFLLFILPSLKKVALESRHLPYHKIKHSKSQTNFTTQENKSNNTICAYRFIQDIENVCVSVWITDCTQQHSVWINWEWFTSLSPPGHNIDKKTLTDCTQFWNFLNTQTETSSKVHQFYTCSEFQCEVHSAPHDSQVQSISKYPFSLIYIVSSLAAEHQKQITLRSKPV